MPLVVLRLLIARAPQSAGFLLVIIIFIFGLATGRHPARRDSGCRIKSGFRLNSTRAGWQRPALFFLPESSGCGLALLRWNTQSPTPNADMNEEPNMTVCRGVRGATTVAADDKETVLKATRELLALLIRRNGIETADVASAIFTTTPDITSVFPATAARQLGWLDVPLLCAHEMSVPGSLQKCVRIMIHWNTEKNQQEIQHVYLHEARNLRPDKSIVLSEEDMTDLNRWIEEQLARSL